MSCWRNLRGNGNCYIYCYISLKYVELQLSWFPQYSYINSAYTLFEVFCFFFGSALVLIITLLVFAFKSSDFGVLLRVFCCEKANLWWLFLRRVQQRCRSFFRNCLCFAFVRECTFLCTWKDDWLYVLILHFFDKHGKS